MNFKNEINETLNEGLSYGVALIFEFKQIRNIYAKLSNAILPCLKIQKRPHFINTQKIIVEKPHHLLNVLGKVGIGTR